MVQKSKIILVFSDYLTYICTKKQNNSEMSRSQEWKNRRERYVSERRRNAKARLEQAGFTVTEEDKYCLSFLFHCNTIRYYPYTGGVVGKGIKPTRGIDALIKQISTI